MQGHLQFGYEAETPETKARWFQSLSVQERIDLFVELTNLALARNPDLARKKPIQAGAFVLTLP